MKHAITAYSNPDLLMSIRQHATDERHAGLLVIQELREVKRRRLYASLGYSNLHQFCMEELKYSSGSAWRRIQAMEALRELPELETKVIEGRLTLSSVSQVQSFCEQKKKSLDEKREIFGQVENLSKRKTEQILATIAPLPTPKESLRAIDPSHSRLVVTLDEATIEKLDQIKAWLSHSGAGYAAAIARLADLGLQHLDPARKVRGETRKETTPSQKTSPPAEVAHIRSGDQTGPAPQTLNPGSIPAQARREVWRRDQGRCTYVCPATLKRCASRKLLQIDHITPRAKGGTHELTNLRLRCRAHNLLAAIQSFGAPKMEAYLR